MSEGAVAARMPYDAYRASGQGWLGSVPEHWEVERVKRVAQLVSGHTPSRKVEAYWEDCTIPWVTLADVGPLRAEAIDEIETTSELVSELGVAASSARVLPARTVVLSRTASVGFAGVAAVPLATSQDYFNWICGPRLRPEYLLFCFRAMRDEFRRVTDGSTHQTIYWPDAEQFTIPLPPLTEQDAVVAFLSEERRRLAELIEREERLLALLIERAEALVTSACLGDEAPGTVGDPAYAWIPDPREGLDVVPLKRIASFISRGTAPEYTAGIGTPILGQTCVYWDGLRPQNARMHASLHVFGVKGLLRRGDVLVNSTGSGTLGRAAVFDEEETYLADGHLTIVRPKPDRLRSKYLAYLLRTAAYRAFVERVLTVGSTDQLELSRDKLAAAPIVLPLPEVQDEIVARLDRELAPNLELQRQTRRRIGLLWEYRHALTCAAVTGRIRCS